MKLLGYDYKFIDIKIIDCWNETHEFFFCGGTIKKRLKYIKELLSFRRENFKIKYKFIKFIYC